MPHLYDIAILGATPAGLAAAYRLATSGLDVVVLAVDNAQVACPLAEWIGIDAAGLSGLPPSLTRACKARAFRSVHYHNTELDADAKYLSRGVAGYFLKSAALSRGLRAAAAKAGAVVRSSRTWPRIVLAEDTVALHAALKTSARMLLVAAGRPGRVLADLGLPDVPGGAGGMAASALQVPLGAAAAKKLSRSLHVLQLPGRVGLGMLFVLGSSLHLRVVGPEAQAPRQARIVSEVVASFQDAGMLPRSLGLGKAVGASWRPPGGIAIDLETHAAKRCLLIGTAGGFAETITGHTVRPGLQSGLLAAEVVLKAIKATDPQSALMSFRNIWRKALVDYLRPPNTSLQMLLPLLFANRRMVGKFTRALLYGKNI